MSSLMEDEHHKSKVKDVRVYREADIDTNNFLTELKINEESPSELVQENKYTCQMNLLQNEEMKKELPGSYRRKVVG